MTTHDIGGWCSGKEERSLPLFAQCMKSLSCFQDPVPCLRLILRTGFQNCLEEQKSLVPCTLKLEAWYTCPRNTSHRSYLTVSTQQREAHIWTRYTGSYGRRWLWIWWEVREEDATGDRSRTTKGMIATILSILSQPSVRLSNSTLRIISDYSDTGHIGETRTKEEEGKLISEIGSHRILMWIHCTLPRNIIHAFLSSCLGICLCSLPLLSC